MTQPTVAALGESFGRGSMTNHWVDMKNSDCLLIMGSNAAENHPISMKWVMKAKANGAKVISVDPRLHENFLHIGLLHGIEVRDGHSLPGRNDQLHHREKQVFQRLC